MPGDVSRLSLRSAILLLAWTVAGGFGRANAGVAREEPGAFKPLWLYWCMDANDHAAEPRAGWESLRPGQEVEVREPGQAGGAGVIDDLTPDGSVVWVWLNGQSPRRMFLEGDPVVIHPQVPDAF